MPVRRFLPLGVLATAVAAVLFAVVLTVPAQAASQTQTQAPAAAVQAVPRPDTIPGGGGNVRNLGPNVLFVNNVRVLAGFTSYQSGIKDASKVEAPNHPGYRDLKGWRMINGRWIGQGCRIGSDSAGAFWAIGNGDFAFQATSCGLGFSSVRSFTIRSVALAA